MLSPNPHSFMPSRLQIQYRDSFVYYIPPDIQCPLFLYRYSGNKRSVSYKFPESSLQFFNFKHLQMLTFGYWINFLSSCYFNIHFNIIFLCTLFLPNGFFLWWILSMVWFLYPSYIQYPLFRYRYSGNKRLVSYKFPESSLHFFKF